METPGGLSSQKTSTSVRPEFTCMDHFFTITTNKNLLMPISKLYEYSDQLWIPPGCCPAPEMSGHEDTKKKAVRDSKRSSGTQFLSSQWTWEMAVYRSRGDQDKERTARLTVEDLKTWVAIHFSHYWAISAYCKYICRVIKRKTYIITTQNLEASEVWKRTSRQVWYNFDNFLLTVSSTVVPPCGGLFTQFIVSSRTHLGDGTVSV